MAEVHALKSSGRITVQGQQMYYELLLAQPHYLLKFYDSLGKVRLVRPIRMPLERAEFHGVGEYLLCYESPSGRAAQGAIYIVKLSDLRSPTLRYNFTLECGGGGSRKIRHAFSEGEQGLIVLADAERNIYLLRVGEDRIEGRLVGQHGREVSALSFGNQAGRCQIVVVDKEAVSFLAFDPLSLVLSDSREEGSLVGYYRGDGYVVHYAKHREWRSREAREGSVNSDNYYMQIDKEAELAEFDQTSKFPYEFPMDSQIVIQSGRDYLVVLNKSEGVILSVYDDQFRVTQVEDNLMHCLGNNNFLTSFHTDEDFNVLLEIRIFGIIESQFTLYQYVISDKPSSDELFLKKNLHLIFQPNALVSPLYLEQAHHHLHAFLASKDEYKNSKELKNEEGKEHFRSSLVAQQFEEGIKLLRTALQHFPASLEKLLRRVKANVQASKTVCYIEETARFFEYCEYIVEEEMQLLIEIAHSINPQDSVLRSQDRDELARSKKLLESMINFLFSFLGILAIEANEPSKNQHSQKKLWDKIKSHENVYNSAKSLFLVACLLEDEEILGKFEERMKAIAREREENERIWEESVAFRLDYRPLLPHDHFPLIALFQEEGAEFADLVQFLVANRASFVENAYFYQSISRIGCAPYLDSDTGDLIDNICFHLPLRDLRGANSYNEADLLTKMAGTALKLQLFPFTKYLVQLSAFYAQHALSTMLVFSGAFAVPGDYEVTSSMKQHHLFAVKTLILAGRVDLAHLYVLDHYSQEMFQEFARLVHAFGSEGELLQLAVKGLVLHEDQDELRELLEIEGRRWELLFDLPQECKEMELNTDTS